MLLLFSVNRLRLVAALFMVGIAGASASLSSCGARSALPVSLVCSEAGEVRACADNCGAGEQVCENGFWQPCRVPRTSRPCTNACGTGIEWCENQTWGACEVSPATRTCTNECGTGSERCENARWGTCEVAPVSVPCESVCGVGEKICKSGRWEPCNAPQPRPPKLAAVVRDFSDEHPDFELDVLGDFSETGIVAPELGPDDKPVYAARPDSRTTSGRANFDQWYNDFPGVNARTLVDLEFERSPDTPGLFVYRDLEFFPIDGRLLGNEGRNHNYHFTLEARTTFRYIGGEIFRFSGDDDFWVFINRRLAIDLGGLHEALTATVDLDDAAAELGIKRGETYSLHFFFAERHTVESEFVIETSIAEPGSCE
jgi:fibro-slime domain-containing protein